MEYTEILKLKKMLEDAGIPFNPLVIYTMYLYDTGKMKIDRRFFKKEK